ncbi:hypothetical protein FHX37_2754 [Haloactinospora alba]|uniref:Histone acetyltransferase Rv0428c-like SH3 domain-containing protein n=1 Tax=Haloactinospora alba TaxID=405555 RepID=A0A543NLR1_9ACTN|nr:hypothetical protein [Haloactinospora alba]TQN32771.1 hypothetical protein FHX37_2754 [Haloactinospora alba]
MGFVSRFTQEVTSHDVGRRATLRSQLPDGRFRDIVGVLESWQDGVIHVRRRDGTLAEVAADTVVASRIVPQQPPRRRTTPGS